VAEGYRIVVRGAPEAIRGLENRWAQVRLGMLRAHQKIGLSIAGRIKRSFNTSDYPKVISGNLRRNIGSRVEQGATTITTIIYAGAQAPYAEPLEFGAAPHVILRRRKKAPHWIMRVNHPGNRPYHFMLDGLLEERPHIASRFSTEIHAALRGEST
jgi:hypothetical protein